VRALAEALGAGLRGARDPLAALKRRYGGAVVKLWLGDGSAAVVERFERYEGFISSHDWRRRRRGARPADGVIRDRG
jgi:hypothetical protein